jgi:hypothetical protein
MADENPTPTDEEPTGADDGGPGSGEPAGEEPSEHRESFGERFHHAEERVEDAFKDTVARVENRMILAGEAETSASPEVNLAAALDVAISPPGVPDDAETGEPKSAAEKPEGAAEKPENATDQPPSADEGAEGPAKA